MRICTIILHYNDAELTMSYVNNLKKLKWMDYENTIIIVDNNSPDGSGAVLKHQYRDDNNVIVLLSQENVGFAKGNNLGIIYARQKFNPDLYIISNDDIVIENMDFPKKLVAEYNKSKFAVWGPDIFSTRRNSHQSPIRDEYINMDDLKKYIHDIDTKIGLLHFIDKLHIYNLLSRIKKKVGKRKDSKSYNLRQYGVVLQGAFFVLSNKYIEEYEDGLYPNTFLYMEEDILNLRCKIKNLKVIYDPSIQVKHLEGGSTYKLLNDRCKKYIFELEETKKSCLQMIMYITEITHEKN